MRTPKITLKTLYQVLRKDERITTWHLGLCLTLFFLWQEQGCPSVLYASRSILMDFTHIKSIVTYHKCIRELQRFGYITYEPTYDPLKGSSFALLPRNVIVR